MRHLLLLASVYVAIVALALPGSILAQGEPTTETTAAQPAPAEPAPPPPEPAPPPAQPAPAQPAPAAPATAPAGHADPAAEAAAPEPQILADEGAGSRDPKPKAIAAASGSVTIADFSFAPATITINQGDTVTWNNNGPTPHSATANDGSFDTGILKKGRSASHTFNQAGTFSYFCEPHPFMKASVVVQAASDSGGGGTSGSGSADTSSSTDAGATASSDSSASGSGSSLPNTGSDSGALLALGGLMLLLGAAIHRRARATEPGPAGRIGL
jgi:LPXTG-motif cell wall-anchored protein